MEYKVLIRPEAEKDLATAFLWYEDKRRGLGHDFVLRVDSGLRFIARNPCVFAPGYKDTRNNFIKRFPYKIVYLVVEKLIVVLGVIHSRRNPQLVQQRINSRTR